LEKILIQYAPDGKSVAEKLRQILMQHNFAVSSGANSLDDNDLPEVVIAVFSAKADTTPAFINILDTCQEKDVTVVPFVMSNMDKTATQRYFLNDHVWIDNTETVFSSAAEDLVDLLTKNYADLADRKRAKKERESKKQRRAASSSKTVAKSGSEKETMYKNICYMLGAVVLILLGILMFQPRGDDKSSTNKSLNQVDRNVDIRSFENPLVGSWQMSSYVDNQFRATRQDSIEHQQLVDALVSSAKLVFTSDRRFTRSGFSETPEKGYWEYDPSSHYLKLQPEDSESFDQVQLQELSDTRMIIVVNEKVDNLDIITKMIFTKVSK